MREREEGGLRCSQVLELLSDYVDGDLTPEVVARVEAHVHACPNCERFGAGFAEMLEALRGAASSGSLPAALLARIEAALEDD